MGCNACCIAGPNQGGTTGTTGWAILDDVKYLYMFVRSSCHEQTVQIDFAELMFKGYDKHTYILIIIYSDSSNASSAHIRMDRSASIDPVAIMFWLGCV